MDGVHINFKFRPIKVRQFSKWTGKTIFNEKSSITQVHNIVHRQNGKQPEL